MGARERAARSRRGGRVRGAARPPAPAPPRGAPAARAARRSAAGPKLAIAAIKRCVHEGGQLPLEQGLALEAELMESLFRSRDATEGLPAFVEKREPSFVGA